MEIYPLCQCKQRNGFVDLTVLTQFKCPSLLVGDSLSCPTPNCATRGLICAIAQIDYLQAFLHLPNPNLVTWSVENLVLCFISYSSHSSSSSPSSCLVFGNKRSSWAGRGIASLQLAQALWTWQRHHCIHFCDHLQWIHVLQICNKLPLLIQVHKARRDVNIYLLPSLYFTYIFYDVHSKLGDSWRFNQGLDSKCFRTGGKPDSP